MKIVCSWCGADMGENDVEPTVEGLDIEHSICEKCKADVVEQFHESEYGKQIVTDAESATEDDACPYCGVSQVSHDCQFVKPQNGRLE